MYSNAINSNARPTSTCIGNNAAANKPATAAAAARTAKKGIVVGVNQRPMGTTTGPRSEMPRRQKVTAPSAAAIRPQPTKPPTGSAGARQEHQQLNQAQQQQRPKQKAMARPQQMQQPPIVPVPPCTKNSVDSKPRAPIITASATARNRPAPASLKAKLKQQIADLKRAKLLRAQEKQAAERKRQLEEKRRIEETAAAKLRQAQEAERTRQQAEWATRNADRLEKEKEEAARKKVVADAKRYEMTVRSEVATVVSELVSKVESRNGEGLKKKRLQHHNQQHQAKTTAAIPAPYPAHSTGIQQQLLHQPFSPLEYGQGPLSPIPGPIMMNHYPPNAVIPSYHPMGYPIQQHTIAQQHGTVHLGPWSSTVTTSSTTARKQADDVKSAARNSVSTSAAKTPIAPVSSQKVTPSPFPQGQVSSRTADTGSSPTKEPVQTSVVAVAAAAAAAEPNKFLSFASPTPSSTTATGPGTTISPSKLDAPADDFIIDNILKEMEEEEIDQISPINNFSKDISPIMSERTNRTKLVRDSIPSATSQSLTEPSSQHASPAGPSLPSDQSAVACTGPWASPLPGTVPPHIAYPVEHPLPPYPYAPYPYEYHYHHGYSYPQVMAPFPPPPKAKYGGANSSNESRCQSATRYAGWVASASKSVVSVESSSKSKLSPGKHAATSASSSQKNSNVPLLLHEHLLDPPSPFAASYDIVQSPVVTTKVIGGSFGIDLRLITRSALVDPTPEEAAIQGTTSMPQSSRSSTPQKPPPRQKRKRVYFSAMIADNTKKQNDRKDAAKKGSDIIRPGDIVLSVDGRSTGGLSFQQACGLFALAKAPAKGDEGKAIQCLLTIARPKITPPTYIGGPPSLPTKIPFLLGENGRVTSGEFSDGEVKALLDGIKSVRTYGDLILPLPKGQRPIEFLQALLSHPTIGAALSRRDSSAIVMKLSYAKAMYDALMKGEANKHWRKQWKEECERA